MSGSTATASGDRSVAVGGDIRDSIVVTGDRNVLVVPEALAGTLLQRVTRLPTITARGRPVAVLPPAYGDRVGRAEEIASLRGYTGRALSVVGEGLIGKTYVLSAAFDAATSVATPDGIVFLYGRERPLRDLLQAVWEAFYDSDPPTVPSDAQIRRELADREGIVIVDSAELTHADAQALAAALPRSRIVVVTRERSWWDGDAVTVAGLAEGDALALLARELGGHVAPADEVAAREVCQALGGRPVAIKQVAGLVRGGEPLAAVAERLRGLGTGSAASGGEDVPPARAPSGGGDAGTVVARAAVERATAPEQELLAALMPFRGVPVGVPLLDELLGRSTGGEAAVLAERGLLRRGSPRFALALPAGAVAMLDARVAEQTAQRAVRWATQAPRAALDSELDPLLALWRALAHHAPYEAVAALGRVLVPALVRARRFATWGGMAEHLEGVARAAGDTATQAWARHELGTQAVATGDAGRGAALLREALSMRRELGDRAGVRATRRNLRFVTVPPGPPPWMRSVVFGLVTVAVALVLIAILNNGDDVDDTRFEPTDGEAEAATDEPGATEPTEEPGTDGTEEPETDTDPTDPDGTEAETDPGTEATEPETDPDTEATEPETDPDTEATEPETDPETEPPIPWRVTVTRVGDGRVRSIVDGVLVTGVPDDPDVAWINCPEQCEAELEPGQSMRLEAEADEAWIFVGWGSEACPEARTCTVEGDTDVVLIPRFEPRVVLDVILADDGATVDDVSIDQGVVPPDADVSVAVDVGDTTPLALLDIDAGETCEDRCSYELPVGTTVTLTATAADPWFFESWIERYDGWERTEGCDDSEEECSLTLLGDATITATFENRD